MRATDISKVLTKCRFNPMKEPSMKLMVEVKDLGYYIPRLMELAHLANVERLQKNYPAMHKHLFDLIKVAVIAILFSAERPTIKEPVIPVCKGSEGS